MPELPRYFSYSARRGVRRESCPSSPRDAPTKNVRCLSRRGQLSRSAARHAPLHLGPRKLLGWEPTPNPSSLTRTRARRFDGLLDRVTSDRALGGVHPADHGNCSCSLQDWGQGTGDRICGPSDTKFEQLRLDGSCLSQLVWSWGSAYDENDFWCTGILSQLAIVCKWAHDDRFSRSAAESR